MTVERKMVGKKGEEAARYLLEEKGYRIIETNYRCPLGEIDLIAAEGKTIVFVEVRTKTGMAFGSPEESINTEKSRRLYRLAQYYLKVNSKNEHPVRIDLVAIMMDRTSLAVKSINHIRGILN